MKNRTKLIAAIVVTAAVAVPSTAFAAGHVFRPDPYRAHSFVTGDTPLIADGVAIGKNVSWYKSSGLGPAASNTAPGASPEERYIPTDVFPGGELSDGVTITEAQGINALTRIGANLESAGLDYDDVISMRVFLQNPAGEEKMDFAGWNRAYRQFFANTNLATGEVLDVQLGSSTTEPMVVNGARPSRFALEVENLPVDGWLVEVEVDAVYPR
ncbi:enamine deaminase RidA (YjgF/YER057c/UK114 family) [Promicromonospora sp. AC04]|uniref:Rid family hydrolase n=1 Tax=Promicromonospora sp. AC04 TaxID=2135723 RepID=UPI000D3CC5A0|nr:Rid family hydrolase [Promicromonospora sp. AC04]PUB30003.1 enamine deaminase RidA (YjgF/YER057c/UK114 family) [Promicromonospora sp. AC04]